MSSVKYTRIPLSDNSKEELMSAFDYSSPFSYDDSEQAKWNKYKSPFTYGGTTTIHIENESKEVSTSGRHFAADNMARLLVIFGFIVVYVVTFPVMVWFSFKRIKMHERFVIFRLGRLQKCRGPGMVFMFPLLDRCHKIDIRLKAFSVPPKQIITEDGAIVEIGAEIYFQIVDAQKSVTNVQNLNQSTRILLQTALCNIISKKALSEIESERRSIADTLMANSNETCTGWGVEIQRAELSQIKVLQESQPKATPTLMMPPGLFGLADGTGSQGLPSALLNLATAVMSKQGPQQTEAISEAFKAFACLNEQAMPPVETPALGQLNADSNQPASLMHPANVDRACAPKPPAENATSRYYSRDQLIAAIRSSLGKDLVRSVDAIFQFDITGEQGGLFYLDLKNGSGAIDPGQHPTGQCDTQLAMSMDDLQAMLQGRLQPFHAYMSGRLKVTGETKTALRLEELAKKMKRLGALESPNKIESESGFT